MCLNAVVCKEKEHVISCSRAARSGGWVGIVSEQVVTLRHGEGSHRGRRRAEELGGASLQLCKDCGRRPWSQEGQCVCVS